VPGCASAGLLIQSQSPGGQKSCQGERGDITIGSTVLLTPTRNDKMSMYVYDGQAGCARMVWNKQANTADDDGSVEQRPGQRLTDGVQANGAQASTALQP